MIKRISNFIGRHEEPLWFALTVASTLSLLFNLTVR